MRRPLVILAFFFVAVALYVGVRTSLQTPPPVRAAPAVSPREPVVTDANGLPVLPPTGVAPAVSESPAVQGVGRLQKKGGPVAVSSAPTASTIGVPDASPTQETALVDAGKALRMIHDYHTLMGENPIGTNAEIMKAIMGHNPHQASLGPLDGQGLNEKGELLDQWGTPYFFHQLSRDVMEIHSAGPDKVMGTPDDIVIK